MTGNWWERKGVKGDLRIAGVESHLHVSRKKLKELKKAWENWRVPQKHSAGPPRVHTHGHANRPRPERPDRGRNSQQPNKKKRSPRGKQVGDLLVIDKPDKLVVSILELWSDELMPLAPLPVIIPYEPFGFYASRIPSSGPYIYMGVHPQGHRFREHNIHKLVGPEVLWVIEPVLYVLRTVSRVDRALG